MQQQQNKRMHVQNSYFLSGEDEGSGEISAEQEELSDIKIMKEFDTFVNDKDRDVMKNDEHLQRLLVYSDMAHKINHPSAKKKVG